MTMGGRQNSSISTNWNGSAPRSLSRTPRPLADALLPRAPPSFVVDQVTFGDASRQLWLSSRLLSGFLLHPDPAMRVTVVSCGLPLAPGALDGTQNK